MDNKIQKDQEKPNAISEQPGQKQNVRRKSRVLHMSPGLNSTKRVGKPPKPFLWPDPLTYP